jgi:hypothetical protein
VRRTGRPVRLVKSLDEIPAAVAGTARPNDLVITLGAGSIGSMPDRILEALRGAHVSETAGGSPADVSDEARGEVG